jgi:glycosyltransferase 2 family protein
VRLADFERFWNSRAGGLIKLALGLLVLSYMVSTLDWPVLQSLASRAKPSYLLAIAAVAVTSHLVGALRFKLLCDPVARLPLLTHARQYFTGAYFSMFLPSSIGGDGVRILLLKAAGVATARGTSLVATERVLGAFSLLGVSMAAAMAAPLPEMLRLALAAAVLGATIGLAVLRAISSRFTPKWPPLAMAVDAVRSAVASDRLVSALALSFLYQIATVGVTITVDRVLGLGVPMATILALAPLAWFATMLPISVGGLGVREAAFVFVFAWGGIEKERALLLSLGTYAGLSAIGAVGAVWFTWDRLRGTAASRTEP